MSSSVSFEVMGYRDGHWSIMFVTADRDEAISEAKAAEFGKHVQAVKVIQETTDEETGEERSKTVYSGGLSDGVSKHKHARPKESPKAAPINDSKDDGKQGGGAQQLHSEGVTNLIDRIRKSVIIFGVVALILVILAFSYVSNPEAVSSLFDSLF